MANGKKIKRPKRTKVWKLLTGTYKKKNKKLKEAVDRLIAAIQQDLPWDTKDLETFLKIEQGKIDWSGNVRSKRRTRKHIRKRG